MNQTLTAVLLISCPDRRGLVASLSNFLLERNGNILHFDQHVDLDVNVFFARVEWSLEGFSVQREGLVAAFEPVANKFDMTWRLYFSDQPARMAIFVSRESHCLHDILARYEAGEWPVEIPLIVSNHPDLKPIADRLGIPFHIFPITKENKAEQERRELALLRENGVSFVVLARYMQIISPDFIAHYQNNIINIHHSFLPAFPGAKPYHSAFQRGVKIIGATSHYVTESLDDGPIIEQDVIRVSHKLAVEDFIRQGKDLEKVVLSRAIYAHLRRKILVYNNKTVIFD
jgi:formyltetrahydrofolate deformylase